MFYVRTPREQGEELIGNALSLLWMVVHSVQGIGLKDLKQILRKEQVYHIKYYKNMLLFYLQFLKLILDYFNWSTFASRRNINDENNAFLATISL